MITLISSKVAFYLSNLFRSLILNKSATGARKVKLVFAWFEEYSIVKSTWHFLKAFESIELTVEKEPSLTKDPL